MQKMLILSGLQASGKSTFAKELVAQAPWWFRINWDDMRASFPNYKFPRDEKIIQAESRIQAVEAFNRGKNLLIDNTNLSDSAIAKWTRLAGELDIPVEIKMFDTPVEECVRRDALREGNAQVGRVVIEAAALANGLIKFPKDRKIVIVDVDGTLTDCSHRRIKKLKPCSLCKGTGYSNAYDFSVKPHCENCGGTGTVSGIDWNVFFTAENILADKPKDIVVEWVRELYKDYFVLIVSGRPADRAGKLTVQYLANVGVPYHHIFMRSGRDNRDDRIIKQEILDRILKYVPKHRIAFTIDDRNRVVDMWRQNGLKCIQVVDREEGNF